MGLFKGRPLCFFCTLFLSASVLIIGFDFDKKLFVSAAIALLILSLAIFGISIKRVRQKVLSVVLCFSAVLLALLNAAFRMDIKLQRAEEMIGDREIIASISDVEYISKNSSAFIVKLERVSDSETDIKALLVCRFECEMKVGDKVEAYASVASINDTVMGRSGTDITREKDVLLTAVINQPEDGQIMRFKRELPVYRKLFVQNGAAVILDDIKNAVKERAYFLVGRDGGAIINAFLLGDTSDVSTSVIRDFRRSGASHLFAVSGLHISVLLGAVELLLRRLWVHKYVRCSVISVLALILLVFTGFSMSAVRAVIMLWAVYIAFIFSEESDSPTTLFLAVTLIILIYPYAVFELGLWMSFLATLGLVTVYPIVDSVIPSKLAKGKVCNITWRFTRYAIMVAIMTVIANMFLLPVQWSIFGEASIVGMFANILLSPIVAFVLPLSVVCLVLGSPLLGLLIKAICGFIVKSVGYLSSAEFATVSLEYDFAAPLVVLFTASMIFLLTVRLRRKWLLALPTVAFAILFTGGILIFNEVASKNITYYGENTKEIITVTDSGSLCIVDMSNGAYTRLSSAVADAKRYGVTCVDKLIFTSVSRGHISSMEHLLRNLIVKDIYIPVIKDEEQLENAGRLIALATECGVDVWIYEDDDVFMLRDTSLSVVKTKADDTESLAVFVKGRDSLFGYTDAFLKNDVIKDTLRDCDTVFVGNKGIPDMMYCFDVQKDSSVIYSSEDIWSASRVRSDPQKTYINKYDVIRVRFSFK